MTRNLKVARRSESEILAGMKVAAPCAVSWDSMEGDERARFCGQCEKNVYNISEMSSREAVNLVREKEGRLCVRFYRRADGTVMTDNCPVGLRRIRNLLRLVAVTVLTPLFAIAFSGQADAQGLVGAPACPPIQGQYNGSLGANSVSEPTFDKSQVAVMTASATLAVGWLAMRISKRKSGVFALGVMLFLFFAAVGFMIGMSRGCGFHIP